MKRLRPYRTVTLVTAFSLLGAVLAGCGGGQQNQTSNSPSSGQQGGGQGGVPKEPPITILAPQAPWEPAFQKLVDRYQQQTGNQVSVNVTPFNGMLQKSLNAVQSPQSEFDLLILNEQWYAQFDADKMVTPIQQIDPNFTLDPQVIEYQYATRWNDKLGASTKDGQLYGLPINGNIQLFYYRKDLFDQKGLSAPKTWEDVEKAAQALNDPPTLNGFAIRANPPDFEFQSILYSYGGEIVHLDEKTGQWSVEINKPQALQALQMWLTLGKEYGPKNVASIGQPELIGLLGGGKLAQAGIVAAAVSDLGDPQKSVAAGKIQAVPVPAGPGGQHGAVTGIWLMSVPHNVSSDKQKAALAFMQWALTKENQLQYTKDGAIPVRQDVYETLSSDPKYSWWVQAMAQSTAAMHAPPRMKVTPQIVEVLDRRLSAAIVGQAQPQQTLDTMAQEIYDILKNGGYNVKPLGQ